MATTQQITTPAVERSRGRGLLWLGILLAVLAVVASFVQVQLKFLFVPWYVPAVTTLGLVFVIASLAQRRSVTRIIFFVLIAALAGLEWYFVASLSKLPDYAGPARPGQKIPAFETTLADGRTFTDSDLRDGTSSVLTFFRGRW
jgi:hypothetical protein